MLDTLRYVIGSDQCFGRAHCGAGDGGHDERDLTLAGMRNDQLVVRR